MRRIFLPALAAVLAHGAAYAAVSCPDRVPAPINSVTPPALKCQETIAKEGAKFLVKQMNVLTACKLRGPAGSCPTIKDSDNIGKAAGKAAEKILADCGADTAQAGLTSSYASGTDPAVISSCMLSQHSVIGQWQVANAVGVTAEAWPFTGNERKDCQKEVAKWGKLFLKKARLNAEVCIKKKMKHAVAGDLAPACVGSFAGGLFVPPSDAPTAMKQDKLFTQLADGLAKKCTDAETFGRIPTLFGCAGSSTIADLEQCLACGGWNSTFDALAQEYSETGTYVPNGLGALQTAVTAAADGDKLLVGSGTYQEEVLVTQNDFSIVGCGAATGARPKIIPPVPEVSGRGIRGNALSNVLFQSIEVFGQDNDGIRVTNSNGVTFRDIVADGNLQSAYAVFPQTSNNVLIELCKAKRCNDAPVYVGQSSTITVRWNEVRDSVAAIEIENCGNAHVYGNYATGNTGGLLVFKDGSLPVQLAQCHHVHHNLLENNNTLNFGSGTVAMVPHGTGLLVVSADSTPYHHNISRGHDTFGFAVTDQAFSGFGPPFSADQNPENNFIYDNYISGNGANPDPNPGFGGDFLLVALANLSALGNCQSGNIYETQINLLTLPVCTLPPSFAGCPAPPVP